MRPFLALSALWPVIACAPDATDEISESTGAESEQKLDPSLDSTVYFYCSEQEDGRHYFYINPESPDRGTVGFEFSDAYRRAHPEEVPPINEMTIAISGSGIRFVADRMEFRAKGNEGVLQLSDGKTVECKVREPGFDKQS